MWPLRTVVSFFAERGVGGKIGKACTWSLTQNCIPLQLATMQTMDGLLGLSGPHVL